MTISSVDLGNKIYDKAFAPKYQQEQYLDYILDDDQNEFKCSIKYEYYRYDGQSRIVVLEIRPLQDNRMTNESLIESVKESLMLTEKSYLLECTPDIFPYEYDGECIGGDAWSGGFADNH